MNMGEEANTFLVLF